MILALETSCDETAAALVTATAAIRANVVASQAELHARFGGVVPEVASRRHLELVAPVVRRGARPRRARRLDDVEPSRSRAGPGLVGALLVGLSAAKALAWARGLPLVAVDHLHGHVASLYLEPRAASSRRFSACSRAAATRCCSTCATTARTSCSARRSTTRPARRSTRARACSGSAIRAARRIDRLAREGDPEAFDFPVRARARARLLVLRAEDRAALRGARPRRGRDSSAAAPTSRRATSGRSSARSSSGRTRPPTRPGTTGSPSSAASPRTRSCGPRCPDAALAPLALCTDNAAMIASAARYVEPIPCPDYLALDASCVSGAPPIVAARRPRLRRRGRADRRRPSRAGTAPSPLRVDASSWRGLVGDARPQADARPADDRRPARAVARRASRARRRPRHRRRRSGSGRRRRYAAQTALISELGAHGLRVTVEYSYARVLNGFSAALDDARGGAAGALLGRGRGVSRARRLPGRDRRGAGHGRRVARGEPPGPRRPRRHRGAPRHGGRPHAAGAARPCAGRVRRARQRDDRRGTGEPARSAPRRGARHRDGRHRRRTAAASRRAPRCCRSASPDGSSTRRGGRRCTRGATS